MGKPTALQLARGTLRDAVVVDLRRVNDWSPDTFAVTVADDAPNVLTSGRYVLLSTQEMELVLKRLTTVEQSQLLSKAMKRSGRQSPQRRRK